MSATISADCEICGHLVECDDFTDLSDDVYCLSCTKVINAEYAQCQAESLAEMLRDENVRLVDALRLAKRWLGTDNAIETFDDIAEWFYSDTSVMRPGKSVPLEMGGHHSDEERHEAFGAWCDAKRRLVRDTVGAALAPPSPAPTDGGAT